MTELLHRPKIEFTQLDDGDLFALVTRWNSRRRNPSLYAGFDSKCIVNGLYMPPKQSTFGVTKEEWQLEIEEGGYMDDPIFYALSSSGSGDPAIGAYDTGLLVPVPDAPGVYEPKDNIDLADTCVRIIVWDQ